jgi:molybdopterin-guanine dinucleotide biosynthesis protein A
MSAGRATGAIVLCGGRSSRMGRAKAWLPWRGRPMVAHVVALLRPVVDEVVAVTSPDLDLPPLDVRVVRDPESDGGPLVGLCAGLEAIECDRVFATGTDAPFLTRKFVEALLAVGGPAAPEVDGHVQTLAAVYPGDGDAQARALLGEGRRRPLHLLEAAGYRKLPPEALPDLESLRGFNTADAYLEAVRSDAPDARATIEFVGRPRRLAGVDAVEVPVGTLAEVLGHAPDSLDLVAGDRVAPPYLVSLGGRDFVRDARIPIGPGERVVVIDSGAGG